MNSDYVLTLLINGSKFSVTIDSYNEKYISKLLILYKFITDDNYLLEIGVI